MRCLCLVLLNKFLIKKLLALLKYKKPSSQRITKKFHGQAEWFAGCITRLVDI